MDFKNRTLLASLAATIGVVMVAGLGMVALRAQQGPPPGRGPGGQGRGMVDGRGPGGQGGPGMRAEGMFRGQGGPGMRGGGPGLRGPGARMMMHGLAQLNLTDDQKTKVKDALESHKDAAQAIAKRMIAAREALGDAVTADAVDEALIRAKAAEVAAVEIEAALLRARGHAEVFALLTPDQQAKAKQLRAEAKDRIKQMLDAGQAPGMGRGRGRGMGLGMGRGGRGPGGIQG